MDMMMFKMLSVQLDLVSLGLLLFVTTNLPYGTVGDPGPEKMQMTEVRETVVSEDGAVTYEEKLGWESEQNKCPYFFNERLPHYEGQLINCTWYTSKACCKRTEVTSVFSDMYLIYDASDLCRNYLNYLMCFFCSPNQYRFYQETNNKAMVCMDYCEALYEECKTAGFQKSLIGEKYGNGTAFCRAQHFDVTDHPDCFKFDPTVFGVAPKLSSWPVYVFSLLFLYYHL